MADQVSCPRRFVAGATESDGWDTDRWEPRGASDTSTFFPQGFQPPRTCSYCGGVHPQDALDLMQKGWRIEATDKSYKRYMHPPHGTREASPPVKLYVMHLTPEQIDRFNSLLSKQN